MVETAVRASPELPRVLFVDDEPAVLEGIAANLRRFADVVTAPGAKEGLEILGADASICVVVSDMRMPQMDGATFLSRARQVAPSAIRMLLTGQADTETAIDAINNGQIFRFLTKPCPRETLRTTVSDAVERYRVQMIEREMLEQTVRGSVKMMFDILALAAPAAFGRGTRLKKSVLELATALGILETWQLEVAALSSQLGYVALPHELVERIARGETLNAEERGQVARTSETSIKLLANIPRLESVREVLALHVHPPFHRGQGWRPPNELCAHILRFAIDLDELEAPSGKPLDVAVVKARLPAADVEVMGAYQRLREAAAALGTKEVPLAALRVGMTLAEDVRLSTGAMLVARGYEVTNHFIDRIKAFPAGTIRPLLRVVAT